MSRYLQLIASLSPQELLIFYFLKNKDWTSQKDIIIYRGKDARRTKLLLQGMESKGVLKGKYKGILGSVKNPYKKYYKLKH